MRPQSVSVDLCMVAEPDKYLDWILQLELAFWCSFPRLQLNLHATVGLGGIFVRKSADKR